MDTLTQTTTRALSATSLNGTKVVNSAGENLGHIEDMMIDLNNGRILYAVLSFGGVMGIGDKLFAVPFGAFTINQHDENFILDVDQEHLENAPGFDKNDWPLSSDMEFRNRVYEYYSIEPYWEFAALR